MKILVRFKLILDVGFLTIMFHLVFANQAFAADKITCVVDDFHYGIWMIDPVEQSDKTPDPGVVDKPILKAIGKAFSKKLDGTGHFEVETRDEADLAPGEKFKAASVLVLAELSCMGTSPTKQSAISIDARVVRTTNSEILESVHAREMIEGGIVWPSSLAGYSSEDFQKSVTGQALEASLDKIATELSKKAAQISVRLNPPPTQQNGSPRKLLRPVRPIPKGNVGDFDNY